MKFLRPLVLIACCILASGLPARAASPELLTNSLGIELAPIAPGSFQQGSPKQGSHDGEFDERPVHQVNITQPFYIGVTPITNAQYEQFDPQHKAQRGQNSASSGDDEAVVKVSWREAVAFCEWLSEKEGRPYRLPTEAEWEYAARAGTTTPYFTGQELPEVFQHAQAEQWTPVEVDLTVGKTPPNAWGLKDVHGLVEEWCADWYGPYPDGEVSDPVGPEDGDFRVTRGGSHSTPVRYLRSSARSGTLPEDRNWLIGFRIVQAPAPTTKPAARSGDVPQWARNVSQTAHQWSAAADDKRQPLFSAPIEFVKIPVGSNGPLFSEHNHCPALTVCPNGDLLAIWYTTRHEPGRELAVAASRLRRDAAEWEPAAPFWDAPGRNDHGDALWWDGDQTLYHFNGLSAADTWGSLALILRTSADNGATWSKARLIEPRHGLRNQPIANVIRTSSGQIILNCDAVTGGEGGTAVHISSDGGQSWHDPGRGKPAPKFAAGESGAWIAGIHAGLVELHGEQSVELNHSRLMALGRGDAIAGEMPRSISDGGGKTWAYSASGLPPISGGQRLALLRLQEGPLLLVSFTNPKPQPKQPPSGLQFVDQQGNAFTGFGMYAALSFDEGETWPVRRLMTDGASRQLDGGAWTGEFTLDKTHAEPAGYLDAKQSPDGKIHLISSKLYYCFNFAWLNQTNANGETATTE